MRNSKPKKDFSQHVAFTPEMHAWVFGIVARLTAERGKRVSADDAMRWVREQLREKAEVAC
jgi:hypothetical protein